MTNLSQPDEFGRKTTDDGFTVWPYTAGENRFLARPTGYYADSVAGATEEEALDKARKADARRKAQDAEDAAITEAYDLDARRMQGYTSRDPVSTPPPASLKPGQRVRLWAHGRSRIGIVGTVSKTGARARVIYRTPSSPYPHVSTYSRTALGEVL